MSQRPSTHKSELSRACVVEFGMSKSNCAEIYLTRFHLGGEMRKKDRNHWIIFPAPTVTMVGMILYRIYAPLSRRDFAGAICVAVIILFGVLVACYLMESESRQDWLVGFVFGVLMVIALFVSFLLLYATL